MKLRTATFAGIAAAGAIMLSLSGCHKTKSGGNAGESTRPAPAPASITALLDFNARETARIVASATDRPARLDRMIVAIGQPNPNMLWLVGLRTSRPFACHTQTATMVRCFAALSWVGSDVVAGYANVMLYDHDITIDDLLTDANRTDPAKPDQKIMISTPAMYTAAADGSYNGPYATCRQAIGPNANGPATCFALLGSRTAMWAQLAADTPAYDSDGSPRMDTRPHTAVSAIDDMIQQLRTVKIKPDGSFAVYELPVAGPDMAFDGAGWYASDDGLFVKDSLFAGPYDNEQACKSDLPRAASAFSQFLREVRTIDQCKYYGSAPEGI